MTMIRLLLIASLLVTNVSMPQENAPLTRERIQALVQSSFTYVDGKQTPELVPFSFRMQLFFDLFRSGSFGSQLKPMLPPQDHTILAEFANENPQLLKKDERDYMNSWMRIGESAQSMNGVEIASAVQAATDEVQERQAARYRTVLGRLTPGGRQIVSDFAFARVRPQVSIENPLIVATAEPGFYKAQVLGAYEMAITGKKPPGWDTAPNVPSRRGAIQNSTDSSEAGQLGSSPAQ